MIIYAISGITLVFRATDAFKSAVTRQIEVDPNISIEELGRELRIRNFQATENENLVEFEAGSLDRATGIATVTSMELPAWLDKITHLHKATTNDPLYYFNIFFGVSLFFFSISAFFMFLPKTPIYRKGIYFTLGGIVLTIIMLLV